VRNSSVVLSAPLHARFRRGEEGLSEAVHIYLREDVRFSFNFNLDDGRNISYGPDSKPIGVELLGVSQGVDLTADVYGCG
jgi:hypothetical protein